LLHSEAHRKRSRIFTVVISDEHDVHRRRAERQLGGGSTFETVADPGK
jgi:hypothetical protein